VVYKKYIKRNGKVFGPYYYESYRENGKVKTRFISGPKSKDNKNWSRLIMFILIGIVIIGGLGYYFYGDYVGEGGPEGIVGEIIPIISANRLIDGVIGESVFDLVSGRDDNWLSLVNGEIIRVSFDRKLNEKNDISFYAKGKGNVEIYSRGELILSYEVNEDKLYKKYLRELKEPSDSYDLKISGNVEFDYIFDPVVIPSFSWNHTLNLMDIGSGHAIVAGINDSVYVTGYSGNAHMYKLNASNGTSIWFDDIDLGEVEYGAGIDVDLVNDVYVAIYGQIAAGSGFHLVIYKYNSSGSVADIYNYSVGNSANGDLHTELNDLVVDTDFGVYIGGALNSTNEESNSYLAKHNQSNLSEHFWNVTYNWGGHDTVLDIEVDNRDAVYALIQNGSHPVIAKYNATNGNPIMNFTSNGPIIADYFRAMSYHNDSLYVVGYSETTTVVRSYNASNGSRIWSESVGSASDYILNGITNDKTGNITVTGNFSGTMFVMSLFPNGTHIWNLTHSNATGIDVAVDNDLGVYVTGNFSGSYISYKFNNTDTINPDVLIRFPLNNTNHSSANLDINYTRSDLNLASCWYGNDTYTKNITLASCVNLTTITWTEGNHNITIYVNDTAGNNNQSSISFFIDTTSPVVSLFAPPNNSYYASSTIGFVGNYTDSNWLVNATPYLWNSTNNIVNSSETQDVTGILNNSNVSIILPRDDVYHWNYLVCDVVNNCAWNNTNYTITLDTINPDVSIVSPLNNTNSSDLKLDVNFTRSDTNLASCWYSNDTHTKNVTLASCVNLSTITWSAGQHNVTIWVNDSAGNENSSSITFSTNASFNSTPVVTLLDPADSSSYTANTQEIVFGYNVSTPNPLSNCSLYIGGSLNSTNLSITNHAINNFTVTFSTGTFNWNVNCTDNVLNTGNSSNRSFTITAPSSGGGGGGGGGGSGGSGGGGGGTPVSSGGDSDGGEDSGNEEEFILKDLIAPPDFDCGDWQKCSASYGGYDLESINVELRGEQIRTCNNGIFEMVQRRDCSPRSQIRVQGLLTESGLLADKIVGIFDKNDVKIANINLKSIIDDGTVVDQVDFEFFLGGNNFIRKNNIRDYNLVWDLLRNSFVYYRQL